MRWYRSLKRKHKGSFFNYYNEQELRDYTIVAKEVSYYGNSSREYALFRNYGSLLRHIHRTPKAYRSYHELILETSFQKPRFDIDIEADECMAMELSELAELAEEVKDQVISSCISILSEHVDIDIEENFAIYCSSGEYKGGYKESYHIIVDKYYHDNCYEAKAFYEKVLTNIDPNYHKYIDHNIYGKNKTLRMLHCTKMRENRVKRFLSTFTYLGKIYQFKLMIEPDSDNRRHIYQFITSLVTAVQYCKSLPRFCSQNDTRIYSLVKGKYKEALDLFSNIYKPDYRNYFDLYDTEYNQILLLNRDSYLCIVCNKVHESQNPYLYVFPDGDVYFNCRRCTSRGKRIGNIGICDDETYDRMNYILSQPVDTLTPSTGSVNVDNNISWNPVIVSCARDISDNVIIFDAPDPPKLELEYEEITQPNYSIFDNYRPLLKYALHNKPVNTERANINTDCKTLSNQSVDTYIEVLPKQLASVSINAEIGTLSNQSANITTNTETETNNTLAEYRVKIDNSILDKLLNPNKKRNKGSVNVGFSLRNISRRTKVIKFCPKFSLRR